MTTNSPHTMTAYRLLNWGEQPQKVDVEKPCPAAGQVLVKVAGVGVCGSDPKMSAIPEAIGAMLDWQMPFTLGHEVGGWIDSVGDGVQGFEIGDAVVLVSSHSCGGCSFCLEGQDLNCREGRYGRGYGRDGGLATYVLVEHPREIIKLGSLDPVTAGPLTDAGATAYHGVRRILPKLKPGATAVIIGAGGLGSFALQFIKLLSAAQVIAVDTNAARLAYAKELGADVVIDSSDGQAAQQLRYSLGEDGAAAVMDFVGADETIELGIGCLRAGGSFALVGAQGGTLRQSWFSALPKDGEVLTYEGATIVDTQEVVRLAEAGKIRNDVELYEFEQVEIAYQKLVRGELLGRAVIKMTDTSN